MAINYPVEKLRSRLTFGNTILVGQQPSSNEPVEPLSALNPIWSGARLARMAGMTPAEFESFFLRVNVNYLGDEPFKVNQLTRARAKDIWVGFHETDRVILLGAAVLKCFRGLVPASLFDSPFETGVTYSGMKIAVIPHPSGVNRYYNCPTNVMEVGLFLQQVRRGEW